MPKLLYNPRECGWECSECGAIYSGEEMARVFDYCTRDIDEQREYINEGIPVSCHCMDCGILWEDLGEKEDY